MENQEIAPEEGVKTMPTMTPQYDPAKQYTWPKEAEFKLTGAQFGVWLNYVRSILQTPEAVQFQMAAQSSVVIEEIMKEGVESGVIIEMPNSPGPGK